MRKVKESIYQYPLTPDDMISSDYGELCEIAVEHFSSPNCGLNCELNTTVDITKEKHRWVIKEADGDEIYREMTTQRMEPWGDVSFVTDKEFNTKHLAFGFLMKNYKKIQKKTGIKNWHVVDDAYELTTSYSFIDNTTNDNTNKGLDAQDSINNLNKALNSSSQSD